MDTCTALCLVFPTETHQKINEIRTKYDKAYPRWMPHINFIFPFVPAERFDEMAARLGDLGSFGGFDLHMNQIGYFDQGQTVTFHIKPSNQILLQRLFNTIRLALPEIEVKHDEFHPHLTLGQFPKSEIEIRQAELKTWLGSGIQVKVDRIHMINRNKTDGAPFQINREISLTQAREARSGTSRTVAKSIDRTKFRNGKIAAFIDNSGSTAGAILKYEIQLANMLLDSKNFVERSVFWNTSCRVKTDRISSEGGTSPKCIFDNVEATKMFAEAEIVLFMTDGEIEAHEVAEFSNRLKNHLNKSLFVCVFVSGRINDFSKFNVSVMSPIMIGPNVLCLYLILPTKRCVC